MSQQFGNLMNEIAVNQSKPSDLPKVGDGATIFMWSDREAGTVVAVGKERGKLVVDVREDNATRTDNNGMSEMQTYEYSPNPEGRIWRFTLTKHGWRALGTRGKGPGAHFGSRRKYHDFSF